MKQPPVEIFTAFPEGYRAMLALERACRDSGLDLPTFELIKLRASQINGCAFCIDMHYKDARAAGETEERLYMLPAWWETTLYSQAERAALALTEAVTNIAGRGVPEDVEAAARDQFDERTYAALLFSIATINSWNRLCIASHQEPGHYQPRSH
jgi:AhpD family alkylhydroperoxidase